MHLSSTRGRGGDQEKKIRNVRKPVCRFPRLDPLTQTRGAVFKPETPGRHPAASSLYVRPRPSVGIPLRSCPSVSRTTPASRASRRGGRPADGRRLVWSRKRHLPRDYDIDPPGYQTPAGCCTRPADAVALVMSRRERAVTLHFFARMKPGMTRLVPCSPNPEFRIGSCFGSGSL